MEKRADNRDLLMEHDKASGWVDEAENSAVHNFDERLNLVNRTLASKTQLRSGHERWWSPQADLMFKYRLYRRLYRRADLSKTPWARPYVEMMAELMDGLRLR